MAKVKKEGTGQVTGKQSGMTGQAAGDPNYTSQPQATNQAEVDAQDSRTRLWQSLDTSYGAQRDEISKQYEQALQSADNQALNRGMQRSSYNAANLANINQNKIQALDNNYNQQIADYQNRLFNLEQAEQEQANWQAQFDAQQAQQQWSNAFQQSQFDAQQAQQNWSNEFQQAQFDAQQAQWREQFDYNQMTANQQIAYNYLMNMLEAGDNPSDSLLQQAGISRKDYEQMKKAAVKSSGGGRRTQQQNQNPTGETTQTTPEGNNTQAAQQNLLNGLNNFFNNNQNGQNGQTGNNSTPVGYLPSLEVEEPKRGSDTTKTTINNVPKIKSQLLVKDKPNTNFR